MVEVLNPKITANETGVKESTVPAEAAEETAVPFWDLRPKGPQGFPDGAESRQIARMNHLIEVGALELGIVRGREERVVHNPKQRTTITKAIIACEPILISEMIPAAKNPPEGYVTPMWPENQPEWQMNGDLSKLPPEQE